MPKKADKIQIINYDPSSVSWEKQPFETDTEFSHFVIFRDLPFETRSRMSWSQVAQYLGRAPSYDKTLAEIADKNDWVRRVNQYDAHKKHTDKDYLKARQEESEISLYAAALKLEEMWNRAVESIQIEAEYVKTELLAQDPSLARAELTFSAHTIANFADARDKIETMKRKALKMPQQIAAQKIDVEVKDTTFDKFIEERMRMRRELGSGEVDRNG